MPLTIMDTVTFPEIDIMQLPLGTSLDEFGCHFTIHAPAAHNLHLVLFKENNTPRYIELHCKHGQLHHVYVPHVRAGEIYSYCMISKHGKQWLVDPYAKHLSAHPLGSRMPVARVVDNEFDWMGIQKPMTERANTILYEVHVKGFTAQHPDVPQALRGKYLGLCHPSVIEHFVEMGITTLQLMPVTSSVDEAHLQDKSLTNYWGYNPLCWFAPDNRFAIEDPVTELKTMVRELHRHGIEVVLDVVYNHTAESGDGGSTYHFKALDPLFYLHNTKGKIENFTGCGNTVDLLHPPALRTVMDSLRYWVEEFQIDGFRFDLAATLGRRGQVFDKYCGFFQAIYQDPTLQHIKLIAEPWDIGPDGYQLGHFPMGWVECNDKFRDSMRSFWHGHHHYLGEFATRQMGSRDLFSAAVWPQKYSVNYICYHDGFTLQDLVSYNHKHNEANGEENRDGHSDNRSFNHGVEGDTDEQSIIRAREQQKRNLITTLMFSFGMPHLLATDSMSHSQNGNNNAYCQDNELSWTNWEPSPLKDNFRLWLSDVIALRKRWMQPMITAFTGDQRNTNRVFWRRHNGEPMHWNDWESDQTVSLHLGIGKSGDELTLLVNPSGVSTPFKLPSGKGWIKIIDTVESKIAINPKSDVKLSSYELAPHSMAILVR